MENICYVFLRDGTIPEQAKIHPTPNVETVAIATCGPKPWSSPATPAP